MSSEKYNIRLYQTTKWLKDNLYYMITTNINEVPPALRQHSRSDRMARIATAEAVAVPGSGAGDEDEVDSASNGRARPTNRAKSRSND